MKYMGSKNRISKHILPIITKNLKNDQYYVELFSGGCNLIDKVRHPLRIANDINKPLISLFTALLNGWEPPVYITKEEYYHIWKNQYLYPLELIGWACFCCSFSGKPFSGYAGINNGKGGVRNYQEEAIRNLKKQIMGLQGVVFSSVNYDEVSIPKNSIVYLDPPYKNTTGYRIKFCHDKFYNFCRNISRDHVVYISEYQMPSDFICIWSGELKSSFSLNGMYPMESMKAKISTEKLFIHESQFNGNYTKIKPAIS